MGITSFSPYSRVSTPYFCMRFVNCGGFLEELPKLRFYFQHKLCVTAASYTLWHTTNAIYLFSVKILVTLARLFTKLIFFVVVI